MKRSIYLPKGDGMRSVFATITLIFAFASAAFADAPPANTTWKNTRGSILEITAVDGAGVITGKFTNNAVGTLCLATPYDIVGHDLKKGFFFGVAFPAPCYTI